MIGSSASTLVEYDRAEQWLREGIEYADRTEQWNHRHYMASHQAHVWWCQGRWDEADRAAQQAARPRARAASRPGSPPCTSPASSRSAAVSSTPAVRAPGRGARRRRGDARAAALLAGAVGPGRVRAAPRRPRAAVALTAGRVRRVARGRRRGQPLPVPGHRDPGPAGAAGPGRAPGVGGPGRRRPAGARHPRHAAGRRPRRRPDPAGRWPYRQGARPARRRARRLVGPGPVVGGPVVRARPGSVRGRVEPPHRGLDARGGRARRRRRRWRPSPLLEAAAAIGSRLDEHDAAQPWSPLTLREFEVARLVAGDSPTARSPRSCGSPRARPGRTWSTSAPSSAPAGARRSRRGSPRSRRRPPRRAGRGRAGRAPRPRSSASAARGGPARPHG